ncbi:protein phosphatase inhibitor [Pyronema omphalodes]|nr:protein phosphatase inhibitor [Pyronema omphalodes]
MISATRIPDAAVASEPAQTEPPRAPDGTLRLRGAPIQTRRVTWGEDVVDNEHLGKKKSKVCCIYHRPRDPDDSSSSEESEDDDDDDNSDSEKPKKNAYEKMPKQKKRHHHHHHDHTMKHKGVISYGA